MLSTVRKHPSANVNPDSPRYGHHRWVIQMNFQWREGVHGQCALYEELIRDDGKVLGCIMRFYEENCPTYAMTETKRLGPKKDDQAARWAVEEAMSEIGHQAD